MVQALHFCVFCLFLKLLLNFIVDKLVGIVNTQKVTKENMDALKEQQKVHSNLNALLTQIMVRIRTLIIVKGVKIAFLN